MREIRLTGDVEPPVRVNLYLIDAADAPDCASIGTTPRDLATAEHRSLPVVWPLESEGVVFEDLPADSEWVVAGVGMTDAAEVAFGCVDGVQITDGAVTYTDMVLRNEPMPMDGTYTASTQRPRHERRFCGRLRSTDYSSESAAVLERVMV